MPLYKEMEEPSVLARCKNGIKAGQSLVEVALGLPILLLILFGAIDLGRLYFSYVTITNASREGARYGMTNSADSSFVSDVQNAAANENGGVVSASNVDVKCAALGSDPTNSSSYGSCSSPQVGGSVQVTVTYNFEFATLYIFGVSHITLSNLTRMPILN